MSDRLLRLVDNREFKSLFIEELNWESTPRRAFITQGFQEHKLEAVAQYKGLTVWVCWDLPDESEQREINRRLERESTERLVIFAGPDSQDWRWPRHGQLGSVNAKLMRHRHTNNQPDPDLLDRLRALMLPVEERPSLTTLLSKIRAVFDCESETASARAARLMGTLFKLLELRKSDEHVATQLLSRLLFLWFGDDAGMWETGTFEAWLHNHTNGENLGAQLDRLFSLLDDPHTDVARDLPEEFQGFRYINGGLFSEQLQLPTLGEDFRSRLLEACAFDWSIISPAIFGSMFQTVKDSNARRKLGEHYTTETNILRVIRPLFLDELQVRFEDAQQLPEHRSAEALKALTRLRNRLAEIRVLDPACGCGNFLILTYRELRALEHQIIIEQRRRKLFLGRQSLKDQPRLQLGEEYSDTVVRMSNFAGIEIEAWPAAIAQTAMLLVDHQANQDQAEDLGISIVRLPIDNSNRPQIIQANALRTEWKDVFPPTSHTYIVGNPPFVGQAKKTKSQIADLETVWGDEYQGYLDYVTAWFKKSSDYFTNTRRGRFAFVSTNSICQGKPVPALFGPLFSVGWRIRFAHQTFAWSSEAPEKANVHCVIVGFDRNEDSKPQLFTYSNVDSEPTATRVSFINAYLTDAPNLLVPSRTTPLSPELPQVSRGSQPTDGGSLIVESDEYEKFARDPFAAKYLRPYRMGEEFIRGGDRWCLWMADSDFDPEDIEHSQLLRERINRCHAKRKDSKKDKTKRDAATAHLFQERRQPSAPFVAIPAVVSANREYYTAAFLQPDIICGNQIYTAIDPDGLVFGIVSSSMFISWQRLIGGAVKSDLRFSNQVVWNNFPLPRLSTPQREAIISAGRKVLNTRSKFSNLTLAELYSPGLIPAELLFAHNQLDEAVDRAFGARTTCATNEERIQLLCDSYLALTRDH